VGLQFQAKQLFKPLPLCLVVALLVCKCNRFYFVGLLGVCGGFASSKRDRFFIFAALPCLVCFVGLQFQAKQLLNLCRFAYL